MWLYLTTSTLLAVLVLSLLWWLFTPRPSGLPPGPGFALPLLGHLHLLDKDPRAQFGAWRRQYGDVFSLYMGSRLVVVLNGYPAIKEALVKNADHLSDRPRTFHNDKISNYKGVISSSGRTWKEQRKVTLEILRDFGMGKNTLAEKIEEEVTHYVQFVEDLQGAPTDLTLVTQVSVSNNICSIIFGKRFQYDDPDFKGYLTAVSNNLAALSGTALLNHFPVLDCIPGDLFGMKKVMSNTELIHKFVDQQVAQHSLEGSERGTDFIHHYLLHSLQHQNNGNQRSTLNEENLRQCLIDLFVAGSETTSTALCWALLFFLHYPEVQDKCFKEICDVTGTDRLPDLSDRSQMTYVEATTLEVLRKGDIGPIALPHSVSKDTRICDFVIPEGSVIIPNLHSVLQDPDIWGDPENFRPERFIGPDGKVTRPEEFIAFSTGRRVCLGEPLARMELFFYLTALIQRFRFLPAPEPEVLPSLEGVFGLTCSPQHYKVCAMPRK